ncbi:MNIO family bufferin maturase [Chachezhania sediminis]|uniref:MNIO family bufferin maturase n=1 Tax=Chachezhania sediminis TaxID=2599291 RepID=UPI00131C1AAD|nr:DUF692 domain-containing protein [Chachezhania sediminis]
MPSLTCLPPAPGIGFKPQHFADLTAGPGPVAWVEIHAENYMGDGGRPLAQLAHLAGAMPVSVHGVGLSIGGEGPLDRDHLDRLARVVDRSGASAVSEHLAWSSHGGAYYNDLLPLPYTDSTLERVAGHVARVQDRLARPILLENPSSYLSFAESTWDEPAFLAEVARRTGCGLLLDLNNVFVSATNLGFAPQAYVGALPLDRVGEIHLGGHAAETDETGAPLLIDDHGSPVADPVWSLLDFTLARSGPLPVLIEWDNDVPDWPILRAEAARAGDALTAARQGAEMPLWA